MGGMHPKILVSVGHMLIGRIEEMTILPRYEMRLMRVVEDSSCVVIIEKKNECILGGKRRRKCR
jgi:hypothetical protein